MQIIRLPLKEIDLARNIWQAIESRVPSTTLMNTWRWVEIWIDTFGDMIPVEFIYGSVNNQPCGISLIARETGRPIPFPVKNYYIGTAGEPYKDWIHMIHNDILVLPEHKKEFILALFTTLHKEFNWEEITIDFFTKDTIAPFYDILQSQQYAYKVHKETACIFDLHSVRTQSKKVLDVLPSSTKYKIKRCIKAFNDDLTYEYAETVEQAMDIFHELIDLHQKTWIKRGKRGMFSSDRFTTFHTNLIKKSFVTGSIGLFRVSSKKYGTLGCVYLLIENNNALMYQTGMNDFEGVEFENTNSNRIKPGLVTHALCLQKCLEKGINQYNFGPGEYRYKNELSNTQEELVTISVRKSIKPTIRDILWNTYVTFEKNNTLKKCISPLYAMYKKFV